MKKRIITMALAALLVLSMSVTAYADYDAEAALEAEAVENETEETPVTGGIEDAEVIAEAEENPFTPAGTGTVVDYATDEDGKEFYTITTPSENIFYLIIDRQRSDGNVYFLNAVTEADLMALAEISETAEPEPVAETPAPVQTEEAEAEAEPEPEAEKSGGMGSILLVVLILLVGGGAGWYFKIYKPKKQRADTEDDFEYDEAESDLYDLDEADPYGDDLYGGDSDVEDNSPPWDVDDSIGDDEE